MRTKGIEPPSTWPSAAAASLRNLARRAENSTADRSRSPVTAQGRRDPESSAVVSVTSNCARSVRRCAWPMSRQPAAPAVEPALPCQSAAVRPSFAARLITRRPRGLVRRGVSLRSMRPRSHVAQNQHGRPHLVGDGQLGRPASAWGDRTLTVDRRSGLAPVQAGGREQGGRRRVRGPWRADAACPLEQFMQAEVREARADVPVRRHSARGPTDVLLRSV
jgi:hypothetical protein